MFAYCLNNPTSRTDFGGEASYACFSEDVLLFDNYLKNDGGGGFSTSAFASGLATLALVASAAIAANEKDRPVTIADARTTESRQNYQYWEAELIGGKIIIGNGLTLSEASTRVASEKNVVCANQAAAMWIVIINGYVNYIGPEIGIGEGFLWHYHPHRNTHTHIWFFGGAI